MALTFPLEMTVDQIAELPGAADAFGWDSDDEDPLTERIRQYIGNGTTPMMKLYLDYHGFSYDENGFKARDRESIVRAARLFGVFMMEYDEYPMSPAREELRSKFGTSTSWYLFELGGDDDVDYMGTQPSCLTDLLISVIGADSEN